MGARRCPCCLCFLKSFHMLGLRYNLFGELFFGLHTRSDANPASQGKNRKQPRRAKAETETESISPVGHKESTPESPPEPTPGSSAPEPTESVSMISPILSANGMNGLRTPPHSPASVLHAKGRRNSLSSSRALSGNFGSMNQLARRATGGYKIAFVQESAAALKKKSMAELGVGVHQTISDVSFVSFLEWIRSERLTTLPHKGSRWDRVLIRALYFAEQLHNFDLAIQGFALDSSVAAALGYGHAQLLLGVRAQHCVFVLLIADVEKLGYENSETLDKSFTVFYKFSLAFSSLLHRSELLAATSDIREQLCLMYTDLLSLVVDVAVRFYKTVNGMFSLSLCGLLLNETRDDDVFR